MSIRNHFATRQLNYQLSIICPSQSLRQVRRELRLACQQHALKAVTREESLPAVAAGRAEYEPLSMLVLEFHCRAEVAMNLLQDVALYLGRLPLTRLRLDVLSVADWPPAGKAPLESRPAAHAAA